MITKPQLFYQLRLWHRRISLALLVWVFFVACTGIALNHSQDFGLDKLPLPSAVARSVYGVEPAPIRSFYSASAWISQTGNSLYWQDTPLGYCPELLGVARVKGEIFAACSDSLSILTTQGEVIERQTASLGLPTPISAFGLCAGKPCLSHDGQNFSLDPQQYTWQQESASLESQPPGITPKGLRQRLEALTTPPDFKFERLIQDLHSGAFFGLGPWLMDIFAVALMAISLLGFGVWWLNRRR